MQCDKCNAKKWNGKNIILQIFGFLKTPFVPFIVLKTTVSIPRFQCKKKRTTVGRDICKNVFKHGTPNQTATPFYFSQLSPYDEEKNLL